MDRLNIRKGEIEGSIRVCRDKGKNWFCLSDICSLLGIRRDAASAHARKTSENDKKKFKKYIFISLNIAENFIQNARTQQSKEIKKFLPGYLRKYDSDGFIEDEDDQTESFQANYKNYLKPNFEDEKYRDIFIDDMDRLIKLINIVNNTIYKYSINNPNNKVQETDLSLTKYPNMDQDTLKLYYETEKMRLENERLKLETQRLKYITGNSKEIMQEIKRVNQEILKCNDISSVEKSRILGSLRYVEEN